MSRAIGTAAKLRGITVWLERPSRRPVPVLHFLFQRVFGAVAPCPPKIFASVEILPALAVAQALVRRRDAGELCHRASRPVRVEDSREHAERLFELFL